jgi:hypothetical protein
MRSPLALGPAQCFVLLAKILLINLPPPNRTPERWRDRSFVAHASAVQTHFRETVFCLWPIR